MNDIQIQTACCKIIADMGSYIVQIRKTLWGITFIIIDYDGVFNKSDWKG